MTYDGDSSTAVALLRAATQLVDGIQAGLVGRGFADVRPAHGFAFARIAAGQATVIELATHLGVTKQAASQLVEQLVQRGYVTRSVDPRDSRARLLQLTSRGRDCTLAAEQAAAETVACWRNQIGDIPLEAMHAALTSVVVPGPLRPAW